VGKSHGSIRERINLCSSCGKPVVDDNYYTITTRHNSGKYMYHMDYAACANAKELAKDWYRQNDRTRTQTYNRIKTRLQDGDGYTGDTDDSVPVWLRDMEP